MNSPERNLLKDTVLTFGMLGFAVVWVLMVALHAFFAADPGADLHHRSAVSAPAAVSGLAAAPATYKGA
jgi:hypothetical protein